MSDNQNENHNTIKPTVQKQNVRLQRPQTEGYQKDDTSEQNISGQTKSAQKPSLNLSASVYIPKSLGSSTNTAGATDKTLPSSTTNAQSTMLNTNTPSFTPKMNYSSNNMNMNSQMNPIPGNYNMNQSNFYFLLNNLKFTKF